MSLKMKRMSGLAAMLCVLAFALSDAHAGRADVGTSGAVFLKLNAGSRPAAMGEAFAGIADDVNAIYYNPAGTALLPKPEFTAQYGSWFQSISYNALGFVYPVRNIGTFGLGVVNLGVSDIEKRAADTETPDSTFSASDYAYYLHYSRQVVRHIAAGVNVKIINQKLDTESATAYAGDAGILWETPVAGLSAGLAVQNLGTEVKFNKTGDPLPLNIKTGFGYALEWEDRSRLTMGIDVNLPRDNDLLLSGGGEYRRQVSKDFSCALRAGYKNVSQEKLGGMAGITAGAGITWRQFGLDFAWVPYGDLGDTFRYSLVVKF